MDNYIYCKQPNNLPPKNPTTMAKEPKILGFIDLKTNKAKARKKVQERNKSFKGLTFYMVGGALTTEKPERDL